MTILLTQSYNHMKTCSKCHFPKPLTEYSKDRGKKDGLHSRCKLCNRAVVTAWQKTPRGKAMHAANADRWQCAPENKASHAIAVNRYQKTARGKAKLRAAWARYNACKIQRTPPWITSEQLSEIESFYKRAKELELQTNTPMHVDHIVPLQGETVSGLHVPWNLQVISAPLNWSKGNRF